MLIKQLIHENSQRLKTYFTIICYFQENHAYIEALNNSTMINFRNDVDLFKLLQTFI